jgi:hypothetical protein
MAVMYIFIIRETAIFEATLSLSDVDVKYAAYEYFMLTLRQNIVILNCYGTRKIVRVCFFLFFFRFFVSSFFFFLFFVFFLFCFCLVLR